MLYMHQITRRSNKMRSSKQSCLQNIYKPTKVRNSNENWKLEYSRSFLTFSSVCIKFLFAIVRIIIRIICHFFQCQCQCLCNSNCTCWWRPQLFAVLGLGGSSWPPGWWWQVDLALINPEKDRVCLNNTAPGQMFGQAEQTVGKQPMSFLGWDQNLCQFWVCCHFKNTVTILPYQNPHFLCGIILPFENLKHCC